MTKLSYEQAERIALDHWGDVWNWEPCNVEGAWYFNTDHGGGMVADIALFDETDRMLIEAYITPKDGAFAFASGDECALPAFVSGIWRASDLAGPDPTKEQLMEAEKTFRSRFFNPRMARYTADILVEEHPELKENAALAFEAWCEAHCLVPSFTEGSALPANDEIWQAARRAAEIVHEPEHRDELATIEI